MIYDLHSTKLTKRLEKDETCCLEITFLLAYNPPIRNIYHLYIYIPLYNSPCLLAGLKNANLDTTYQGEPFETTIEFGMESMQVVCQTGRVRSLFQGARMPKSLPG